MEDILKVLRTYVAEEILRGNADDLNAQTPLLEWGLLNSIEIVKLLSFIDDRFEVEVPFEMIDEARFRNLETISTLILGLSEALPLKG